MEVCTAFPLSFPEALLPVARHNWALIPSEALCGFSGSRKLITAINCEHQQSASSPAVSPRLRGPTKCWFRAKAERRQWWSSPPAGSPSLWQLNKNQCKLLIGSLIIDAVLLQFRGREQKRGKGETVCMLKHSHHARKVIQCHVTALVEADLKTWTYILKQKAQVHSLIKHKTHYNITQIIGYKRLN